MSKMSRGQVWAKKFEGLETMITMQELCHPAVNLAAKFQERVLKNLNLWTDYFQKGYETFCEGWSGVFNSFNMADAAGLARKSSDISGRLKSAAEWQMNAANDLIKYSTEHIEPMAMSLPHETIWEDEHVNLILCYPDDKKELRVSDEPTVIYVAFTGRSAVLADYNSKYEPDKESSLARAAIKGGLGPVMIAEFKSAHDSILNHSTKEYEQTQHNISEFIRKEFGMPPHMIGICQQGYFVTWGLAARPEDANTLVRVASSFDPTVGDNYLKRLVQDISMEDVDDFLEASGNRMPARWMAYFWRILEDPAYFSGGKNINMYRKIIEGTYDPERDMTFRSLMDMDCDRDIPGGLYRDLISFFKYGLDAPVIKEKDFSRIRFPVCEYTGNDPISPPQTAVEIFRHIGTPLEKRLHLHNNSVGHLGLYSSPKSNTDKYDKDNCWPAIFEWMKKNNRFKCEQPYRYDKSQ